MSDFPRFQQLCPLIETARREDLGQEPQDVTARLTVKPGAVGAATLLQKEVGIVCGLQIVQMVCQVYDPRLQVEQIPGFHMEIIEGRFSEAQQTPLLRIRGPLESLLAVERVVLNFLQHLSGVASYTHQFVRRVEGTQARIYDTRKTLPGLRLLEKYAVRRGGGFNHRMGLYDGLLIKDNHLRGVPIKELPDWLGQIVRASRSQRQERMVEVEVETLEQLGQVLKVPAIDVVLLDNMDCPAMQEAVKMRDAAGGDRRVELEASGGITLQTVRSVAMTGVDRLAVGAITHSAPALDISLEMDG